MSTAYLWIKVAHIVFVTSWFAGLFYLPRLFVNLAMIAPPDSEDGANRGALAERSRLLLMARKLYRFMGPLMVLALAFGLWLWLGYGVGNGSIWLPAKLLIVVFLVGFHVYCGRLLKQFQQGENSHGHVWYRWFNEAPVIALTLAVILVVIKPF